MDKDSRVTLEECLEASEKLDITYSIPPREQRYIYQYAKEVPRGGTVVEIGVAHGRTTTILILVSKECGFHYCGIDDFSMTMNYNIVKSNLDKLNIPYTLIVSKSADVYWKKPIDLLIIDGGHYEAVVKPDCEKYIPFVVPQGIVMFHDYERTFNPSSAHWAIKFYADKHTGDWEDLGLYGGLKIRRKSK